MNAFHATIADCRHGKADKLDLFLAQVTLAGAARARGILGVPVSPHKRRELRAVRAFDPTDFPDGDIRMAVIRTAFGEDKASVTLLRSRAGTLPCDNEGQITLVLAALDGDDIAMRSSLAMLAGTIAAEDRSRISINITSRGEGWARQLASSLR